MGKLSDHNLWKKTINEFYAYNGTIKYKINAKEVIMNHEILTNELG